MQFTSIHHIAIIVSDYEKSKDFYVNKLGFTINNETYRDERQDWLLNLRVNNTTELEIFGMKNPPARVTNPEAAGLRHLAFRVEDARKTAQELQKLGIEVEPIRVDVGDKRFTFFKDPDGLPIEIHE